MCTMIEKVQAENACKCAKFSDINIDKKHIKYAIQKFDHYQPEIETLGTFLGWQQSEWNSSQNMQDDEFDKGYGCDKPIP